MKRQFIALLVCTSCVICTAFAQGPDDERQIRKLIPQFLDAWGHADAAQLASVFAPDGDLIIPTGNVFSGREAIGAFYSSVFQNGYKGSRATGVIERMRFITPDIAIADGRWTIAGAHDQDGKDAPTERGIFSVIVARKRSRWLMSALREQTSAVTLSAASER